MTTVASYSGVYPSHILDPLVRGVPAMKMLSFIAILLPESNPVGSPLISTFVALQQSHRESQQLGVGLEQRKSVLGRVSGL